MSHLPNRIARSFETISSAAASAADLASCLPELLEVEGRCSDVLRAIDAFREAARTLGLVDETRVGQRVYDAWSKLSRFFLEPLGPLARSLESAAGSLVEAPEDLRPLATRWERTWAELNAFLREEVAVDRSLQETPVSTHVGFRVRSRMVLLDHRAERLKVSLELFRREILEAVERGCLEARDRDGPRFSVERERRIAMKWIEEAIATIESLGSKRDESGTVGTSEAADAEALLSRFYRSIEEALASVSTTEDLREILGAASIVTRFLSTWGSFAAPDFEEAVRAADRRSTVPAQVAVVAMGDMGHAALGPLASEPTSGAMRRFYVDLETARIRTVDPDVVEIILEGTLGPEGVSVPRYGDVLRAAYRAASGPKGLPPLLAESLGSAGSYGRAVHVIVGIEDPWVTLAPDLLFDLRSFLDWGRSGRTVAHLVSRPVSRLRGATREALEELERTRSFDDAFIVCSSDPHVERKVARFIQLASAVPELRVPIAEGPERGYFSSYGTAVVPPLGDESPKAWLDTFELVLRQAAPSWIPLNPVLAEMAKESVFYVHPPEQPPPEEAWMLCPDLSAIAVDGIESTLCRVQRGLRLADLHLG